MEVPVLADQQRLSYICSVWLRYNLEDLLEWMGDRVES